MVAFMFFLFMLFTNFISQAFFFSKEWLRSKVGRYKIVFHFCYRIIVVKQEHLIDLVGNKIVNIDLGVRRCLLFLIYYSNCFTESRFTFSVIILSIPKYILV